MSATFRQQSASFVYLSLSLPKGTFVLVAIRVEEREKKRGEIKQSIAESKDRTTAKAKRI
jgi:hypothetical protein